ncbi:MAG: hypothetical protein ABH827_04680 [bacterium]
MAQNQENFSTAKTSQNFAQALTQELAQEIAQELATDAAQLGLLKLALSTFTTIIHESGHAVTASLLFDLESTPQIHIGTFNPEQDATNELFSIRNMHFYKSFSVAEIATLYTLLSAITAYCAYCDHKSLGEITLKSLLNGASPFAYILETKNISQAQKRFLLNISFVACFSLIFNLFYVCTPYKPHGDGAIIWREHMGVTGTGLTVARILSTIEVYGCWGWLIRKYYKARRTLYLQNR